MLVATFDIGTTAVKAVAVRDDGEPVFTGSQVLHTIEKNGFKEQDPEEWYSAFCTLSHALTGKIPAQEMEGAAIAQVCYFNHIPFLIVRAISDKADDSASMDYPTFEAQAIRHSVNLMAEMIRCF